MRAQSNEMKGQAVFFERHSFFPLTLLSIDLKRGKKFTKKEEAHACNGMNEMGSNQKE